MYMILFCPLLKRKLFLNMAFILQNYYANLLVMEICSKLPFKP